MFEITNCVKKAYFNLGKKREILILTRFEVCGYDKCQTPTFWLACYLLLTTSYCTNPQLGHTHF